jgi:hypothetical protein
MYTYLKNKKGSLHEKLETFCGYNLTKNLRISIIFIVATWFLPYVNSVAQYERYVCPGEVTRFSSAVDSVSVYESEGCSTIVYVGGYHAVDITWDASATGHAKLSFHKFSYYQEARPTTYSSIKVTKIISGGVKMEPSALGDIPIDKSETITATLTGLASYNSPPRCSWSIVKSNGAVLVGSENFGTGQSITFSPSEFETQIEDYIGGNENIFILARYIVCGRPYSNRISFLPSLPAPEILGVSSTAPSCSGGSDGVISIDSIRYRGSLYYGNTDIPEMTFYISTESGGTTSKTVTRLPVTFSYVGNEIDIISGKWTIRAAAVVGGREGDVSPDVVATVPESHNVLSVELVSSGAKCFGDNDTLTANVKNGSDNYMFTFTGPDGIICDSVTNNTLPGLSKAGTYSVEVSDRSFIGCANATNEVLIDFPTQLVNQSSITSPIVCHNSTAIITASASGGTNAEKGYTYSINSSDGSWTDDSNPYTYICDPGNYTIVATDENGCEDTIIIPIINPSPISITAKIDNQPANCNPEKGQISMSASNVYIDNNMMTGVLFNLIELDKFDNETIVDNKFAYDSTWNETFAAIPGRYKVRASHSCDDIDESEIFVINPAIHPIITNSDTTITDAACYNGEGQITLNSFSYGGSGYNTSDDPSGFNYYINSEEVTISEILKHKLQYGLTDTLVIQYDSTICSSEPFEIYVNSSPQLLLAKDITEAQCHDVGNITLSATVTGGVSPYTYQWTNVENETVLPDTTSSIDVWDGIYDLRVVDANKCGLNKTVPDGISFAERYTASRPDTLKLFANNVMEADAPGASTGSVTLESSGGGFFHTYSMNGGGFQEAPIFSGLAAGNYTFTVKDEKGCETSLDILVDEAELFSTSIKSVTDVNCHNGSDGEIAITANGGIKPYTFEISGPTGTITQQDSVFSNLPTGTYSIRVSYSTYEYTISDQTITQPSATLTANIDQFGDAVCGQTVGWATVSAAGGTTPYTYLWDENTGSQITQTAENLEAGNYSVLVTDNNGCTADTSIQLTDPNGPVLTQIGATPAPCYYSESGGSATLEVTGGQPDYTIIWQGIDATGLVAEDIGPGEYTATVTDANDCPFTLSGITVSAPDEIIISGTVTNPVCFNDNNGEIIVATEGGIPDYSYQWENISGAGNINSVTGLAAGKYYLQLTDANNCLKTDSFELINPGEIIIDLPDSVFICSGQVATLDAGNPGFYFEWYSGVGFSSDQQIVNIQEQGDYTVVVSNNDGCLNTKNVHLKYENRQLEGAFLLASEASMNDTIVLVEISWPVPDSLVWDIPSDFSRLTDGQAYKELLPLQTGEYTIGMKAYMAGCQDIVEKTITIVPAGSQQSENKVAESLIQEAKLYPNPNSGVFEIEVKLAYESDIRADVFSMKGMRMIPTKYDYGKKEYLLGFNLLRLQPGVYFVNIYVENEMKKLKFVVN